MLSRWIVSYVLPFFGPRRPTTAGSLTNVEHLTMLDAAVDTAPNDKNEAASNHMLFEQRQGSLAFLSLVAGVIYGLTLTLAERNPLHLVLPWDGGVTATRLIAALQPVFDRIHHYPLSEDCATARVLRRPKTWQPVRVPGVRTPGRGGPSGGPCQVRRYGSPGSPKSGSRHRGSKPSP